MTKHKKERRTRPSADTGAAESTFARTDHNTAIPQSGSRLDRGHEVALSSERLSVPFPSILHFTLGEFTKEFGKGQIRNKQCCLVTEGVRASSDLKRMLSGARLNGKAICFTSSGLTITIGGERAHYAITDDAILLDIVRFDDNVLMIDATHPRKAWAQFRTIETIRATSRERKDQINQARRTLDAARKAGTAGPPIKRDRLAALRRALVNRGIEVPLAA